MAGNSNDSAPQRPPRLGPIGGKPVTKPGKLKLSDLTPEVIAELANSKPPPKPLKPLPMPPPQPASKPKPPPVTKKPSTQSRCPSPSGSIDSFIQPPLLNPPPQPASKPPQKLKKLGRLGSFLHPISKKKRH